MAFFQRAEFFFIQLILTIAGVHAVGITVAGWVNHNNKAPKS